MYNETLGLWLPDVVLDFTENKRAAIVGGQRSMEDQRAKLQKIFGFKSLIWEYGNYGKSNHAFRVQEAVLSGNLDVVFGLTAFMGHHLGHILIPTCKKCGVPYININNGYSPNAFSKSIETQIPKKAPAHA